jgi:hypothetical protein
LTNTQKPDTLPAFAQQPIAINVTGEPISLKDDADTLRDRLREEVTALQRDIGSDLSARMLAFQQATGLSVTAVDVHIVSHTARTISGARIVDLGVLTGVAVKTNALEHFSTEPAPFEHRVPGGFYERTADKAQA